MNTRIAGSAVFVSLLGVALFGTPLSVSAQDGEEMTTRVYRVADLVRTVPDYPYRSGLPTTEGAGRKLLGIQPNGSVQSGGGQGGGGMGGGGFFQIGGGGGGVLGGGFAGQLSSSHSLSLDGLIDVISTSIAPDSWRNSGTGEATISSLGMSLVVLQTPPIHKQIESLLQDLREQSDFQKMVTVEVLLLTLQPGEQVHAMKARLVQLNDDADRRSLLSELQQQADYSGQLTCFSGQEVHLASGHRRNVVTSATPVVSAFAIGYQPIITTLHIGTLVQMKPTLNSQDRSVTIDLRCTVTEWNDEGDPTLIQSRTSEVKDPQGNFEGPGGEVSVEIPRINIGTRQLATTIRVPASVPGEAPLPVIVGTLGEAERSASEPDKPAGLMYLILAISQADSVRHP